MASDLVNAYEKNETMKILGRNNFYWLCSPGGTYHREFMDVKSAREGASDKMIMLIDMFALGVMCGIREQRKRQRIGKRKMKAESES